MLSMLSYVASRQSIITAAAPARQRLDDVARRRAALRRRPSLYCLEAQRTM